VKFFSAKNLWVTTLGISVFLTFLCFRPLNSRVYRIIAADGLGYYSYLPARFIYHDEGLNFKWFNDVFNRNYDNHLFDQPTGNFMVPFHGKTINKYYPGQSLLQMPFFFISHAAAQTFNWPADGFSFPYQVGMGVAAIFYVLLGLFFCRRLLMSLFKDSFISALTPLLIFFGTNLFTFTVYSGCYSHAYSFCFITLAFYSAWLFFNRPNKLFYFFLTALFSIIVLTIRPLNAVLLAGLLYFCKPFSIKSFLPTSKDLWKSVGLLSCIGCVLFYSLHIIYKQTGSFLINTYIGEKFYFDDWSHVVDNFFGFQYGMLWYTPLILLCFVSVFAVRNHPKLLFLLLPLLFLILLYSFWWYWNIVARVIVDCSVILALLLAHTFIYFKHHKKTFRIAMFLALVSVPFFQLKAFQLRQHIVDNNYTFDKYYFKYFFTLKQVFVFPVNPNTIVEKQGYFNDFESQVGSQATTVQKFEGRQAAILNNENEYACTQTFPVPGFFGEKGFKKIKASFWIRAGQDMNNVTLVFTFSRRDTTLAYLPFYMTDNLRHGKWDYREYGIDLPENIKPGDQFGVYFWNPSHKKEAYIDNFKIEFLLTDGSDEVTLK